MGDAARRDKKAVANRLDKSIPVPRKRSPLRLAPAIIKAHRHHLAQSTHTQHVAHGALCALLSRSLLTIDTANRSALSFAPFLCLSLQPPRR